MQISSRRHQWNLKCKKYRGLVSTLGSESAFHWAAPPALGALRRRNASTSSSPSRRNADYEHSGSWRCSKHGWCGSALQKPDATNVAGLRTWNSLGRFVKRGEKGIFILAPMVGKRSTKDVATDEPSEDATTEGQRTLYGFRAVYVFDRLSRDLRPSLCALDVIRECHVRESPR